MARHLLSKWWLGAAAFAVTASVSAQDYQNYETVRNAPKYTLDWKSFYEASNVQTAAARAALPHTLDLAYGPDAKEKLDLYFPPHRAKNAPVLLFLHGGGFLEGDRAHYGFLAPAYAKQGVIVAVASYRLASAGFPYPAPTDDAKMAIAWLHANIARYGGNANDIVVSGHSAGAILAAEVGADRRWMAKAGVPAGVVRAFVPVSASYEFAADDRKRDYFVATPELKDQASAIRHIDDPVPRAIIAVGSTETPILAPSQAFRDRLAEKGVAADLIVLPGANHQGSVRALGDPASPLFKAVLAALK